ncbi:V-type ATP synthase subunit I [Eubacterium aggregans]|uniref:V-type ATP synthase subunit I n=1 Tax=Eubacterium aggregans TaxID=81409 RepID=UPI0023F04623|nr:V-type ATP synthase subunit I [Eubacterium aggregans]MDD4690878.1 V-type ATP synthase subunit I [Eubacterium aggregans]
MIVPMKKARLIALKENKESLLKSLQRTGEFMVIEPDDAEQAGGDNDASDLKAQQSKAMLAFLEKYREKSKFFEERPNVDSQTFFSQNPQGADLAAQLEVLNTQMGELHGKIAALKAQNTQLLPWLSLPIPVESLPGTASVAFHTGYVPMPVLEEAVRLVEDAGGDFIRMDVAQEGLASLISLYRKDEADTLDALKAMGFVEGSPPRVVGLTKAVYDRNDDAIKVAEQEMAGIDDQVRKLFPEREKLELLSAQYDAQSERKQVKGSETLETIQIMAWVRSDKLEVVKKAVESVTEFYDLSYTDPGDDEEPPTVTKNSHFLSQFETITDMFSLPKPGTIDPAPIAGLWYWIIFGMMMGDVGYGVAMAILFYAFKKIKKPQGDFGRLINVLFYGSFPTIIFGILFGSYFGETWNPILFAPLDNPINMLIVTLIVGVLHIFSGMGIKIAEEVKAGRWMDAIFDQVSWMVLIVGLGFMFLEPLKTAGMWMAIGGAVVILCTAGREKPGIVGKITGGLLGLYDISSYMSDILSYSRILALSLATGVIGMVMNLLAGMVSGSVIGFIFAILIYLVGHSFNLAMSLLSAYVHDSRLQYIEFFNKFYEGGGYAFKPLSIQSKYIDVIDGENSES